MRNLIIVLALVAKCSVFSAETPLLKLEEVPRALDRLNQDLTTRMRSVAIFVDAEAAAGRLSEPAAQTLRWSLQTALTAPIQIQWRSLISSSRLPTDNAKLMAALTDLEAANTASQTRCTQIAAETMRETHAALVRLLKGDTKPADCEAFEDAARAVRAAFYGNGAFVSHSTSLTYAVSICQRLRSLLAAEVSGQRDRIAAAVFQLQSSSTLHDGSGLSLDVEIQERAIRASKPLNDAIAAAQDALDEAIGTEKSGAEMESALSRFAEACEGYVPGKGVPNLPAARSPRELIPAYDSLVSVWKAAESDSEPEARNASLEKARQALALLPRARTEKIRAVLATIEKKLAERSAKQAQERTATILRRLASVTLPADLDSLAIDLAAWAREAQSSRNPDAENWASLARELATLATLWGSSQPFRLADLSSDPSGRNPAFVAGLRGLRKRIEREVLSRQFRAPELDAPPLKDMEIEAALEALADRLAERREWRRLLDLSEAKMQASAHRERTAPDDSLAALRMFFAAQNLELAEQWLDAAQAYKSVLSSSGAHAPIAPAAEKLKTLLKAHPDVAARLSGSPAPLPGAMPAR